MSTIVQQAEQLADDRLKKVRWALGLSGLLAIVFAIVILVWPSISLFALVILFGAFALVRGIIGLGMAISSRAEEEPGRDPDGEDYDQPEDPGARIEDEVRAEHRGDRTARAEVGHLRFGSRSTTVTRPFSSSAGSSRSPSAS